MHRARLHKSAAKELARLPRAVQESVAELIIEIQRDPFVDAKKMKLSGRLGTPVFRRRTGNYRVVYTVDGDELLVLIIAIGNRKDVYRSLDRLK
ncbi:MAG: type II toxin-antitoxin system RelE/ParE family toxin [Proteobacteria bacterium]|nr:type II toxin-antitoxin system RelE/ParE family toxin [Pseudomonadota bacterium]